MHGPDWLAHLLRPGTYVPGIDVTLSVGNIRGVESHGMMCSERELELSEDHDGIIDLPADAPIGTRFADYAGLNDPVIEIGITPNRPDALGVRGIARDLEAAGIGTMKPLKLPAIKGEGDCPVEVDLSADGAVGILPGLRPSSGERRQKRTIAKMDAAAPQGNWPAPDFGPG